MTNSRFWVSIYVLMFCVFFYKSAAQDYNSIVNKDRKEWHKLLHKNLYTNEQLRKDSVAFFKEVDKLRTAAQKAKDAQLLLEAKFLKYNYLSSRNYSHYLEEMLELKKEIDKEQIPQLQARMAQALGFYYYYEVNRVEKAVESFAESYQYIKKTTLSDLPDKQEMIFNIALNYYLTGYYDTALEYLEIAKQYTNDYYPHLPLVIYNMQGMIYLDKNQLDNAILKFKEVESKARQENRILWVRIAQNSLANAYYLQGNYAKALAETNWTSDEPLTNENVPVVVKRQILRSDIYRDLKQPEKALVEIEKLEQILEENNKSIHERIERPEKILYLRAYAKGLKGEYEEGYALMSEALNEAHKFFTSRNSEQIKKAETKELIDKYFSQQKELEYVNKRNEIIRIGVTLIIILFLIIFYILFQRQRIVFKKRQLQLELDKQRINQELETASERLEFLTQSLLDKNIELQNYQEELLQMEQHNIDNSVITQRENHLRKLMSAAIITDEKWIEFKKAFEKVHSNFIDNLKRKLPHLTEAEVRYIVLRKLNLTPKEIAALLAIQPDSIRLYRYRIRKKHDIEDDSCLEKIISNTP